MSRYYWCYPEFEEIEVGDEFIVLSGGRWRNTTYSDPVKCVRHSKTQFAVENPWGDDPLRFTRKGSQVGGYKTIQRATPEFVKEVKDIQRKQKNEENRKKAEAESAEQALREKYGAEWIHDETIQKILSKIRSLAEVGERELVEFYEKVVGESDPDNPWKVLNYLDWNGEAKLRRATYYRDMATDLHNRLTKICKHWKRGQSFKQSYRYGRGFDKTFLPGHGYEELVGADALVVTELSNTVNHLSNRLFEQNEMVEHEREFLNELKDISGSRYVESYLTLVEPEDKEEVA